MLMRSRGGVTLLELVVAMLVGGMVLGLVASISARQQRVYSDMADAVALTGRLHEASAVLPIDLRGASPTSGDFRAGEARDTSLELRATIASAVVCDAATSSILLAPPGSADSSGDFTSLITAVQAGDTAWLLEGADTLDWTPHAVLSSSSGAAGSCAQLGPRVDSAMSRRSRIALALDGMSAPATVIGAPVRVTRSMRYSLYKSGDGSWYLGERDWNPTTSKFNTIQPVSGPYLSPSAGGLRFTYFDSSGVELPSPVTATRDIALIRIDLRGATGMVRTMSAAGAMKPRVDSVRVVVSLHNRR